MEDEARRMNRLVSDLLSLSRVEAEERMRPSTWSIIGAVLKGTVAAMRPTAELSGNEIVFSSRIGSDAGGGDGGARPDPGDRDQLMQVFLNLTENALKYGGPNRRWSCRCRARMAAAASRAR
jgi:two-component system phosphate regulon sensor histidine kinase PhoR